MTLTGWTLPQSPTGRSSILPPPPWHYSGEVIAVDFTADPRVVDSLVPHGFTTAGDGSCSFVFCDWCSAADLDQRIQADPARGQYREAYLSVKPGVTCASKCTGRDALTKRETIEMDLDYIRNRSFRLDLQLIWKTLKSVVLRSDVY